MSLQGISNSLSALLAGTRRFSVRANNLANISTPGFKSSRADQVDISSGGARLATTQRNFSQGALILTDQPLDLAIQGDGFFQVQTAQGNRFSRSGTFHIDGTGRITDSGGRALSGIGPVPNNAQSVQVQGNGLVQAIMPDGSTVGLGQIKLARFSNPGGLNAHGDSLFSAGPASGQARLGLPGQGVYGSIYSGALESSNVDLTREMVGEIIDVNTIKANIRVLKAQDELLGELLNLTKR